LKDILRGKFKRQRRIESILAGKVYKPKIWKAFWKRAIFPKLLHGLSVETFKKEEMKELDTT